MFLFSFSWADFDFTTQSPDYNISSIATNKLSTKIQKGFIKIFTTPPQAQIFINGKSYGKSPLELNTFKPGDYTITAQIDNYSTDLNMCVRQGEMTVAHIVVIKSVDYFLAYFLLIILGILGLIIFTRIRKKEVKYNSTKRYIFY